MRRRTCLLFAVCFVLPVVECDADEVSDLIERLQSDEPKVRYEAAISLQKLGAKAEPAIESLVSRLDDGGTAGYFIIPYYYIRDAAGGALVQIGKPAVPALIRALDHMDPNARGVAAEALGELGPVAKDALSPLINLCRSDDDKWVRWFAVTSIAKIATDPVDVVPVLKQIVRNHSEDVLVRTAALAAACNVDPNATNILPLLVEGLRDDDGNIVASAAGILGRFGDKAKAAVPVLIATLSTDKLQSVSFADVSFRVPVRTDIVRALKSIGPAAEAAVPRLMEIMTSDDDGRTRIEAAAALARIVPETPEGKQGFSALVSIVRDEESYLQESAVELLGDIGGPKSVDVLIDVLKVERRSDDESLERSVINALGEVGPAAASAVPVLRDLLKDEDQSEVHISIVCTLGRIGPAAKSAVPHFEKLRERYADSDDDWYRQRIDEAIELILVDGEGR